MTQRRDVPSFTTGSVISRDGTMVGYRQVGHGARLIAVHGGGQAAQNLMGLATALADSFTVYVPDRRGRGRSGPPGNEYGLTAECEDLAALLDQTGAHYVFGLSSGAIICLHAALTLPAIHKVAVYEPPLSIDHSTPTQWVARYERELAEGKLGAAILTAVRGTQTAPPLLRLLPRFVLAPLLDAAARQGAADRQVLWMQRPPKRTARRAVLRVLLWPF